MSYSEYRLRLLKLDPFRSHVSCFTHREANSSPGNVKKVKHLFLAILPAFEKLHIHANLGLEVVLETTFMRPMTQAMALVSYASIGFFLSLFPGVLTIHVIV